jgi:hypothetical protein
MLSPGLDRVMLAFAMRVFVMRVFACHASVTGRA